MKPMHRAIVLLLLFVLSPNIITGQSSAVEMGGMLLTLQQLKSGLDSIVNTVDQETAARIRQTELALDGVIAKVKDAMDHGYGLFNNTRDQVMGNISTIMIQTEDIVQGTLGIAFLGVNDNLAQLARILNALPGINIPTYVYALTPPRLRMNATDSHVEVHGFFPDLSKDHPVTVHFQDGRAITLDNYVNNTLGFNCPRNLLSNEETFVSIRFDLPVRHLFGAYYTILPVKARLYVERSTPFTFTVSINGGNPKQWDTVVAKTPMHERADSSRTTNNQTFSASEIFSRLINDNVTYDMSSAEFLAFGPPPAAPAPPPPPAVSTWITTVVRVLLPPPPPPQIIDQGSNPCASGCTSSSGTWSWDAHALRIALSAPECPIHVIWPGVAQLPYQCSGGTHADFTALPTFRVKIRGLQQAEVSISHTTLSLSRKKVSDPMALSPDWTSIEIKGEFRDGKESIESHVRLTSGPSGLLSASDPILWKAEVAGQSLIISTR